jgi:hypothetical protein
MLKMLTKSGHLAVMTAFISMFCVFVTAPHSCGALFFMPGALPLYTPRPLRLSNFCKQKSRPGRSSDDDLLMPGALKRKQKL